MAGTKYKQVAKGTFVSPALGSDGPYELLEVREGRSVIGHQVRCVRSNQMYDVSVLARPTGPQVHDQVMAAFRELAAWLVANDPANESRMRLAVRSLRRIVNADYMADDLQQDVTWIGNADLALRVNFLREFADEATRERLVVFAADIASSSGAISETDAEFIERIGTGMGLPSNAVYDIVVSAMQRPAA